jgi:hypothetical protein
MQAVKHFSTFQLIRVAHWGLMSAIGILWLCCSTESTQKAVNYCSTLLNDRYSSGEFESINQKVEVAYIYLILQRFFYNRHNVQIVPTI